MLHSTKNTRGSQGWFREAYRARRRPPAGCACAASWSWGGQSSSTHLPSRRRWCRRRPRSSRRALRNTKESVYFLSFATTLTVGVISELGSGGVTLTDREVRRDVRDRELVEDHRLQVALTIGRAVQRGELLLLDCDARDYRHHVMS